MICHFEPILKLYFSSMPSFIGLPTSACCPQCQPSTQNRVREDDGAAPVTGSRPLIRRVDAEAKNAGGILIPRRCKKRRWRARWPQQRGRDRGNVEERRDMKKHLLQAAERGDAEAQ